MSRGHRRSLVATLGGGALGVLVACGPSSSTPRSSQGAASTPAGLSEEAGKSGEDKDEESAEDQNTKKESAEAADTARRDELKHHVVAADRILFPYVLLLAAEERPKTPTRDELQAMVRRAFPDNHDDPEVRRLLAMIAREPDEESKRPRLREGGGDVSDPNAYESASEHLALLIEVVEADALVSDGALADFELTRGLSSEERLTLPTRRWALVLRGEYRNQHAVRGLRLLQTLVRVVAHETGALIHDADTLETQGVELFSARRLRAGAGNIADQIPVVPFPDPARPGALRLVTRGMRRFGSVDLELAGLPGDARLLARATFFLHGLALTMVRLGEVDRSGIAIEVPDVITVEIDACVQAYAGRDAQLPRCQECPEELDVHLVERDPEPQDPPEHIVARVVAPRELSDEGDYDPSAWIVQGLAELFGQAASSTAKPSTTVMSKPSTK